MLQFSVGHTPTALALVLGATKAKTTTGSSFPLLILILAFFALYFLWIRPQRAKVRQQQMSQVRSIDVGDEVVTQAGIVGTVQWLDDERVGVEIAPNTTIVVVRAAIGRRVSPPVVNEDEVDDYEEAPDEPADPEAFDHGEAGTDSSPGATDPDERRKWWPGAGGGKS
jgi:preprotein translocase subunit YajC